MRIAPHKGETRTDAQEAERIAKLYDKLSKPGVSRYAGGWLVDKMMTVGPFGQGMVPGVGRTYQTIYAHPDEEGGLVYAQLDVSRYSTGGNLMELGYHGSGILGRMESSRFNTLGVLEPTGRKQGGQDVFRARHWEIGAEESDELVVERPTDFMAMDEDGLLTPIPSSDLTEHGGSKLAHFLASTLGVGEEWERMHPGAFSPDATSPIGSLSDLRSLLERVDRSTAVSASTYELESYA